MAETKVQPASSEKERGAARRGEYLPSRDFFSPFSMMRRFSEEMDRMFSNALGFSRGPSTWGAWTPPLEVRERDGSLEISVELPGLSKDDVKVECSQDGIVPARSGAHRGRRRSGRYAHGNVEPLRHCHCRDQRRPAAYRA